MYRSSAGTRVASQRLFVRVSNTTRPPGSFEFSRTAYTSSPVTWRSSVQAQPPTSTPRKSCAPASRNQFWLTCRGAATFLPAAHLFTAAWQRVRPDWELINWSTSSLNQWTRWRVTTGWATSAWWSFKMANSDFCLTDTLFTIFQLTVSAPARGGTRE